MNRSTANKVIERIKSRLTQAAWSTTTLHRDMLSKITKETKWSKKLDTRHTYSPSYPLHRPLSRRQLFVCNMFCLLVPLHTLRVLNNRRVQVSSRCFAQYSRWRSTCCYSPSTCCSFLELFFEFSSSLSLARSSTCAFNFWINFVVNDGLKNIAFHDPECQKCIQSHWPGLQGNEHSLGTEYWLHWIG